MRALATSAVVGAAIVLLGGCSGGHPAAPGAAGRATGAPPGSGSASASPPVDRSPLKAIAPSAASPPIGAATTPSAPAADACAAFRQFYGDLGAQGPSAHRLVAEAEAVRQAAGDAAALGDPADASLLDDADALLDYVQQPDFPTTGSVTADPVQEMVQDCS